MKKAFETVTAFVEDIVKYIIVLVSYYLCIYLSLKTLNVKKISDYNSFSLKGLALSIFISLLFQKYYYPYSLIENERSYHQNNISILNLF